LLSEVVRQQEDDQQHEQKGAPRAVSSESVLELQRSLSALLSEAVNTGRQQQQQQRHAGEQAALQNNAQQQQQQQCTASAQAPTFYQSPSPAVQQQTTEGFQEFCNPLWAQWSNPNF
jgi:hypothetical protein